MTAYDDGRVSVHLGDCLDVLRSLPDASVDAVVTDPPYGLEFMGKEWDAPWQKGSGTGEHNAGFSAGAPAVPGVRGEIKALPSYTGSTNPTCRNCGGTRNGNDRVGRRACRCDKPEFPNTTLPRMVAFQDWCELWATECLRVLKPGGHMLAFGGTRTWHRLACAVEDAGFEVRDSIAWLYGSGFPKSLDVSKAIDKAAGATREMRVNERWVERYPNGPGGNLSGDGRSEHYDQAKRITDGPLLTSDPATPDAERWQGWGTALKPAFEPVVVARKPLQGTVASNVLAHGTGALNIAATRVTSGDNLVRPAIVRHDNDVLGKGLGAGVQDNPAGRWPANVVLDESQAAALDEQSGVSVSTVADRPRTTSPRSTMAGGQLGGGMTKGGHNDSGGASRFFYVAKAPKRERPRSEDGTAHPTVKPLDLMRWLVRLVTPPGGLVLDPFAGSGTTVEACIVEGFRCLAIEREPDYLPLILQRINRQRDPLEHTRTTGGDLALFDLDGESA